VSESPEISVVVPAYMEAERIGACLEGLSTWLRGQAGGYEVIVVDDGSSDATAAVVQSHETDDRHVQLVSYARNRGKGYAVRTGLAAARGRYVFFTDADLSTPPDEIAPAIELLASHDVVVGTRARPSSRLVERQRWYREGMGRAFNLLLRVLGLARIPDTQCGFKGFRAEVLPALLAELRTDGFAFDVELLAVTDRSGLRIAELPVRWRNHPDSHVRIIRDSSRMLVDVIAVAVRNRRRPVLPAVLGDGSKGQTNR
jgi:dolichyl-phosphate beta-glucosyltransferase